MPPRPWCWCRSQECRSLSLLILTRQARCFRTPEVVSLVASFLRLQVFVAEHDMHWRVLDAASGELVYTLDAFFGEYLPLTNALSWPLCVKLSSCGTRCSAGCRDGHVYVIDVDTGLILRDTRLAIDVGDGACLMLEAATAHEKEASL